MDYHAASDNKGEVSMQQKNKTNLKYNNFLNKIFLRLEIMRLIFTV